MDRIDLGEHIVPYPRWNGQTILDLEDQHLVQILRSLQQLAEIKRQATRWAYCEMLEEADPTMVPMLKVWKDRVQEMNWTQFVEPIFHILATEAMSREIDWDLRLRPDQEIDLSQRGPLEKQIVGALRDCINAHGVITRETAPSAAKRVIGAIKTFNRRSKRNAN